MADDLGARLLKAGLVTGPQLARCLFDGGRAVERGARLACALTESALAEDALVGFFVSSGFPRWVRSEELADRAADVVAMVPEEVARRLLAVPVTDGAEGLVVAMVDPSDHEAVAMLEDVTGRVVVPSPARVSDVRRALEQLPVAEAAGEPAEVVLELTRRRDSGPSPTPTPALTRPPAAAPSPSPAPAPAPASLAPSDIHEISTEITGRTTLEFGPLPLEKAKPSVAAPRAGLDDWSDLSSPGTLAAPVAPPPPARAVGRSEGPLPARRPSAPRPPTRLTDIGAHLAVMRTSWERDEVVRHACEAASTVAEAVVFLALTKGVLKGWAGVGPHLTPEVVHGLWIPTGSPSMFRDVTSRGDSYRGPYGGAAADNLFRAALGTRSTEVALLPVHVSGRCVAVLAADGLKQGDAGMERLAVIAHAAGEGLRRIIASKRP